jgi:hypothetical protein
MHGYCHSIVIIKEMLKQKEGQTPKCHHLLGFPALLSGGCLDGEVNGTNLSLRCQICEANMVGQIFPLPNSTYPKKIATWSKIVVDPNPLPYPHSHLPLNLNISRSKYY